MKLTFHQSLLISSLEQWPKRMYKSDISLTFIVAMVTEIAAKIGRK